MADHDEATPPAPIKTLAVLIQGDLEPQDRRSVYQRPLGAALRRRGLGAIVGSGRFYDEAPKPAPQKAADDAPRRASLSFIELDLADPVAALPTVLEILRRAHRRRGGAERVSLELTEADGEVRLAPLTPPI